VIVDPPAWDGSRAESGRIAGRPAVGCENCERVRSAGFFPATIGPSRQR